VILMYLNRMSAIRQDRVSISGLVTGWRCIIQNLTTQTSIL
jgi:hypothetical protein